MANEPWGAVDGYLVETVIRPAGFFDAILHRSEEARLPAINVSAAQGKLLAVLARAVGARRVLEIGTLGGYSTAWLASGLAEGGRVTTVELEPRHAEVARGNLETAGVGDRVEIVVGRADEVLRRLAHEGGEPFDLVFIDADKPGYAEYLRLCLALSRPGTLILADNVVRHGAVADPESGDENVQGIRRFFEAVAAEPRVQATALQTVGAKGYDGLAFLVVTGGPGGKIAGR